MTPASATSNTREFFFVSNSDDKHELRLKNRHAQIGQANDQQRRAAKAVENIPQPVLIKFRANASDRSVQRPTTDYTQRCVQCNKKRKTARQTNGCSRCHGHGQGSRGRIWRTAEGVEPPAGHSAVHSPGPVAQTNHIVTYPLRWTNSAPAQDHRALHYFYTFAALDLSGYLPGHFWARFVLQSCEVEPLVRPAVAAVANAHLDHRTSESFSPSTLGAYQIALRELRRYMSKEVKPTCEVVLVCCILLYTFDKVRGDFAAADVHLRSALAILSNATGMRRRVRVGPSSSTVGGKDDLHDLTVHFMQMDIEATMQDLDRGPMRALADYGIEAPYLDANSPYQQTFWTPHDCMESWMFICHDVWRFIGTNARYRHVPIFTIPLVIAEDRAKLLSWVKRWKQAMDDYTERHPIPKVKDLPTALFDDTTSRLVLNAINVLIILSHYYTIKWLLEESLGEHNPKPYDKRPEKMLRVGRFVGAGWVLGGLWGATGGLCVGL
ncbi:hypothetical protein DOTSEDRAFT_79140 [Dothistroma septosporum NZE10]|uniref:Zn(2)-C6 fungal-type domain-containing protein n=1 Tax=Dothistroma septosporum (strain NZE10 / CBS 128990) TaxID=675120 RepID=N1PPX2_DOTSN|nr:hypothetical protein DOTSEDRAFT_79140 [Dothistroma septosporum NZE10]